MHNEGSSKVKPANRENDQAKKQEAKAREEELRHNILSSVLSQEARARLSTLGAAKPERARMVENIIIQNVQRGGIRGKVDEAALKDLLEKVNETKRETKISYERRRVFDDSDDDIDSD